MPEVLRFTEVKCGRMTDYNVKEGIQNKIRLLGMLYRVQPAHPLPTMPSEETKALRNQLRMGIWIPSCIFEKLCGCSPL